MNENMHKPKLAILASGRGTNMQSIMKSIDEGLINARIAVVIIDREGAKAFDLAKEANIPSHLVVKKNYINNSEFESQILYYLKKYEVDYIICAGFMKILSAEFVKKYKYRILNIHPSLLPAFKGAHAHRDVLEYGAKVSGCTVHFVDEGMDTGPIILQTSVPVLEDDTEESLAKRVLEKEHIIYPQAISLLLNDRLVVEGRCVRIKQDMK